MKIVFFSHPTFLNHQSMPRFAQMLADGMKRRGHIVEILSPKPTFFTLSIPAPIKKWMAYLDQYVVFPTYVKGKLKKMDANTLFVFTDHALGPWIPMVVGKPHVIHCHDFLAQRSALNEIPENKTSSTGKVYQSYIRKGFQQGKAFISVSEKTRKDLERFLVSKPLISEMVYNGVNASFQPTSVISSRMILQEKFDIQTSDGYFLHVGGNQWYKNREGIIILYNRWRQSSGHRLPLLLLGEYPSIKLKELHESSLYKADIHFLVGTDDFTVKAAYSGATAFLFPSLAEGFGWPIAEAMASGTLVATTNEAPMTEVAGDAAFLMNRMPRELIEIEHWAIEGAMVLEKMVSLSIDERNDCIKKGLENVKRFDLESALDQIEQIYVKVLKDE